MTAHNFGTPGMSPGAAHSPGAIGEDAVEMAQAKEATIESLKDGRFRARWNGQTVADAWSFDECKRLAEGQGFTIKMSVPTHSALAMARAIHAARMMGKP